MKLNPGRNQLLNFHRPSKLGLNRPLKPESIACLRNLSSYKRPKTRGRYPRSRSAAVLVALFVGREGDLYVLLSRRSDELRSYPGDTSLPGGKLERMDYSLENAARREAFEEIGLPLDKTKVPLLCILEPFLAGNHTIVTPVVVLILDQTLRPILNAYEVQSLFSHPLLAFLETSLFREPEPRMIDGHLSSKPQAESASNNISPTLTISSINTTSRPSLTVSPHPSPSPSSLLSPPPPSIDEKFPAKRFASTYALRSPERPYHTYRDILWHGLPVRMHSFLTGREAEGVKPITGLTSAILIRTAQIGYARDPVYELYAPEQANLEDRIAVALQREESLRKACRDEGIARDWVSSHDPQGLTTKGRSARGRL